jgi:hypothetical protein
MNTSALPQWAWIALAVVAALVVVGLVASAARRSRSARLREHFGREYDHTVETAGSRTAAEQALIARAEEVKELDIRPLTAAERERYRGDWKKVEARFVERPTTAAVEAEELIDAVMRARGYPIADFEKHAEHLSVKHPRIVEHYRAGHSALESHERSTEDLRQAMLHYRALFDELAGVNAVGDVERPIGTTHEVVEESSRAAAARRDDERLRR